MLKYFLMRLVVTLITMILYIVDEVCELDALCNSVKQYFPNDQGTMARNHAWVKNILVDFKVSRQENTLSEFKKLLLVELCYNIKEDSPQLTERPLKHSFFLLPISAMPAFLCILSQNKIAE